MLVTTLVIFKPYVGSVTLDEQQESVCPLVHAMKSSCMWSNPANYWSFLLFGLHCYSALYMTGILDEKNQGDQMN